MASKRTIERLRKKVEKAAYDHEHRVPFDKNVEALAEGEDVLVAERHKAEAELYRALYGRNIGDPK